MSTKANGAGVEPKASVDQPKEAASLQDIIALARQGRSEILPKLRKVLKQQPELWKHFGNLALQAQEAWVRLISGKDIYLAETLRHHLDAMRDELAGPNPRPLEKLMVDRLLAVHVQVLYFEAIEAAAPGGENIRLGEYRMDRQDQAHRQFLSAVKMLATVRQLTARTIQVELVQPRFTNPMQSIIPGANGDEPGTSRFATNRNSTAGMGTAGPANGNGRMHGRDRLSGLLQPLAMVGE